MLEARIPYSALVTARSMNGVARDICEAAGMKFAPGYLLEALDLVPLVPTKRTSWWFDPSINSYIVQQEI